MKIIIILSLLITFNFYAQIPAHIKSELTSEHVPVLATKFSMIPPKGFQMEPLVSGFVKESRDVAYIEMLTVHNSFKKRISVKNFEQFGENVKIDRFKFNTKDAIWVSYESEEYPGIKKQKKILYVDFDEKTLLTIVGDYRISIKDEVEKEIQKSMLSVVFTPQKKIVFSDRVGGNVDVEKFGLKRSGYWANKLTYKGDGKEKKLSSTKIHVTIKHDYIDSSNLTQYKKIDKRVFSLSYSNSKVKSDTPVDINPIQIDGLEGYELEYYKRDKKGNIIQVCSTAIVFRGDTYYALQANYRSDILTKKEVQYYKNTFKELFNTFKRK
ncbi:hypothetical protein [Tenacibaculum agarivorans]|uniref:hypothetical protein n=1 Tax=Tenacibaculum agarivorans TaxID=1908389 RepID=UPI00094BB707|nr:hypothetical protein [Tenacibaculum agarivorans]